MELIGLPKPIIPGSEETLSTSCILNIPLISTVDYIPKPLNFTYSILLETGIENREFVLPEYAHDNISNLLYSEIKTKISSDYSSVDITKHHHYLIIHWMFVTCYHLKLTNEVFFHSVSMLDRMLSKCVVAKNKLHLLGIGCLMISAKYNLKNFEPPLASDYRICSDNAYTIDEIFRVERFILYKLDYELCFPTVFCITKLFVSLFNLDNVTELLVNYISCISVLDQEFLKFLPSEMAASAVYLAIKTIYLSNSCCSAIARDHEVTNCSKDMQNFVLWCETSLNYCIESMSIYILSIKKGSKCDIYKKYSTDKNSRLGKLLAVCSSKSRHVL